MAKMWTGLTAGNTDKIADDFNSSISFDSKMYREDIKGSMIHAAMLEKQGIIDSTSADLITDGLQKILDELDSGLLKFDPDCEDIHMFVEQVLTERIGDAGKKLHTARSRNDQVALDLRLYLRREIDGIYAMVVELIRTLLKKAREYELAIMPGYTHLQRAQPILFSHHLLAYMMMFERDLSRLKDCRRRLNYSPIGSCALAGTTYDTDRSYEAEKLGFDGICLNSIDGVSDRDFCVDFLEAAAVIMMHLSRLSEEIVLWSTAEFGFVHLSDSYITGSSIMPQKKNPDMAELTRGKTGRVYGDLMAMLTTLKGIPLAYNKDMQEDKESVFDADETVKMCLGVMTPMIGSMQVDTQRMKEAAQKGFINATDLADYLVRKGMAFRDAYKLSGRLVALCGEKDCVLETLPLEEYRKLSPVIEEDVYSAVDLMTCVENRTSAGGTSPASVAKQMAHIEEILETA